MPAQSLPPRLASPALTPGRAVRIEYLDHHDVDKHREYRFRVYGADGSDEFRLRIASGDFDARRVRVQDGPDLCYQKLVRAIAAGVTAQSDAITIEDVDLFSYRDDHTPVPKRRPSRPASPATPVVAPRRQRQFQPRTPVSPRSPAEPGAPKDGEPALEEGQRVNHALFGTGVTTATTRARTVVSFDRDGPRSFVSSMLEVEVLSPPRTWETTRGGVNRPCKTLGTVVPGAGNGGA
jgi:hypothetical protein